VIEAEETQSRVSNAVSCAEPHEPDRAELSYLTVTVRMKLHTGLNQAVFT